MRVKQQDHVANGRIGRVIELCDTSTTASPSLRLEFIGGTKSKISRAHLEPVDFACLDFEVGAAVTLADAYVGFVLPHVLLLLQCFMRGNLLRQSIT